MLMRLLAAGTRMPAWVDAGVADYAGRLRGDYRLELVEIELGRRGAGDVRRAVEAEGERMLAAAGPRAALVALQVGGRALTTEQLAGWLEERARLGEPLAFCIGGPDGLAPAVDGKACLRWSLSQLTLPHGLARVVVAEALYRAVSIIKGLPYHRP
jgi:23S rRNA (pseudouridine1915-N3)-methyltransferase